MTKIVVGIVMVEHLYLLICFLFVFCLFLFVPFLTRKHHFSTMSRYISFSVHLGIVETGQQCRASLHSDRIPNPNRWILLVFYRLLQKAMIQKLFVSILADLNRSNLEPAVIFHYNGGVTFKIRAWKGTAPAITVWFWICFCICFQVMSLVQFWLVCRIFLWRLPRESLSIASRRCTFAKRNILESCSHFGCSYHHFPHFLHIHTCRNDSFQITTCSSYFQYTGSSSRPEKTTWKPHVFSIRTHSLQKKIIIVSKRINMRRWIKILKHVAIHLISRTNQSNEKEKLLEARLAPPT